jgi:PAS domain S-box-containing protein
LSAELGTTIAPGFEALVFKASRGIEDIYELTYIRKDGTRFPAVVSVTALRDAHGNIIGYLLIGTDNTARKQVEEERMKLDQRLRDQQFYTRSLIESNIDAIMTTDAQGIITDANKQMEELTGCTRDELIGAPFKGYFTDPDRAQAGIKLVLAQGKVTNYELTARTSEGRETVVSYNATTFHDRDRRLQGVFAAARDVTERKLVDRALEEARDAAEEANSAKSDFLARMSHEIRTPMNAIIGMADLLWETALAAQQREYVRIFRKAGSQLLDLINDILDLSKVESGHLELESLELDLGDVVDRTLEIMDIRAREKGLALTARIDPLVPRFLVGDPARLRQVLINLIGNAIKFTEKGGITVRVERDPETDTEGALRFSVIDTGIGVPAETRELIFAPYAQVDTSITRKYGGSGLGLAISRRVVELMRGRIWVEGNSGPGSTFCFTARFALALPPVPRVTPVTRTEASGATHGLRILLAEDSPDNVLLIEAYLEASGFVTELAGDGREAVDKFMQGNYDLVLMDVQMPLMDGYAATREIRAWEAATGRAPVPILALTAHALPEEVRKSLDAGCTAHLTKPVRKVTLLRAIDEHTTGHDPAHVDSAVADLVQSGDFARVGMLGHNMKGSGGGYGFARITLIGGSLEVCAARRDAGGIRAHCADLAAYLDRVSAGNA